MGYSGGDAVQADEELGAVVGVSVLGVGVELTKLISGSIGFEVVVIIKPTIVKMRVTGYRSKQCFKIICCVFVLISFKCMKSFMCLF